MTSVITRQPLFVVTSPYPVTPEVTLFRSTWEDHIIKRHTELTGLEAVVQAVVENLTHVLPTSDEPGRVVFLNQSITSPRGTPLGVVVEQSTGVICTAYYNRSLKTFEPGTVLWSPSGSA